MSKQNTKVFQTHGWGKPRPKSTSNWKEPSKLVKRKLQANTSNHEWVTYAPEERYARLYHLKEQISAKWQFFKL